MYKDREKQKNYQKDQMRKRREGITKGITKSEDVIPETKKPVIPYPAVIIAMADPEKRAKLRRVCQSLGEANVAQDVRYGVSGPTLDVVAEYLTALK